MSATKVVNISENSKQLNWEVVLRTDEHIVQAIAELMTRNYIFSFDEMFLGNLQSWYDKRGKLTPKQSQTAIKTLAKRYGKRLQAIYDDPNNDSFKAYIDMSTTNMDEEFVEIVSEFKLEMECPICDKHVINTSGYTMELGGNGQPSFQTVKCDKCHTTITFQLGAQMRATFTVVENTKKYILLKDEAITTGTMSITNDAEDVVDFLFENNLIGPSTRIFYIDTDDRVDELLHAYGKFDGFKFGYDSLQDFYDNNK
jgi:hypothetical protein